MFDKARQPMERVLLTRVRNGYMLGGDYHPQNCTTEVPYVFATLEDVFGFLKSKDFDCTDE